MHPALAALIGLAADPSPLTDPAMAEAWRALPVGQLEGALLGLTRELQRAVRRVIKAAEDAARPGPQEARDHATRLGGYDPPLLVAHGGSGAYWIRTGDRYAAVTGKLIQTELEREWPDEEWRNDGGAPLSDVSCFARAGRRVDSIVYSMGADVAAVEGRRLVLPCCELADIAPAWSEEVDAWLQRVGGAQYERLLDWITTMGRLDRPTAALYLRGPASAGKGMLVSLLCAQWGGHRAGYADVVLTGWTSALRDSPIVHLDERSPRDRLEQGSAAFRSLVGESERPMIEKNRPAATLWGCPRLVVTANGPDALRLGGEDLSEADEQAIGLRILYIHIADDAVVWLTDFGGREATLRWAMPDGAGARHVRWLMECRQPTRIGSRLLVEGDSAAWLRGSGRREGMARDVLLALARAAGGEDLGQMPEERACEYGDRRVWVEVVKLHRDWQKFTGSDRTPTLGRIGQALGRLGQHVRRRRGMHLDRVRVYEIPAELVIDAAEDAGIGAPDAIARRMGVPVVDEDDLARSPDSR